MPAVPSNLAAAAGKRPGDRELIVGLEVAVRSRPSAAIAGADDWVELRNLGPNRSGLALADVPVGSRLAAALASTLWEGARVERSPTTVLTRVDARLRAAAGPLVGALLATLEQDLCGAWFTLGVGGHPLPVVVRRAGWIDVRGQAGPLLGQGAAGLADDRVGLGPGDAIVLCNRGVTDLRDRAGERFAEEGLPDTLLDHAGAGADAIADAVVTGAATWADEGLRNPVTVVVVRVPPTAADDPEQRLRDIMGLKGDELPLPGYPVGEPYWGVNDRPAPPREARLRLHPELASVPASRRFVDGALHSWRMSELAEGDVALCTSELVTNAVRHSGAPFSVIVRYDGEHVRVEVGDGSRAVPRPRRVSSSESGGRGLAIVERLAAAWGVQHTVDGKRVWFEVPAPAEPLAATAPP